jgi:putative ABC transport system ATP-binding protein
VAVVEVHDAIKEYAHGKQPIRALDGVSLAVEPGELLCIMGPSGSGKSTLLHLLGGLDQPTAGRIVVGGHDLAALSDEKLTGFRRHEVGFVFQFFNLLPTLSAWENVAVPRLLDGQRLGRSRGEAAQLLERVGLGERIEHRPAELSGGEMQRVAIARALINDPALVLADEPTGNLDSRSGAVVLDLLRASAAGDSRALVLVTHDEHVAAVADRVVELADGRLVDPGPR